MVTSTAAIPRNVVPVTPAGHRLLREQLAALTTRERVDASDRVREARSDGGHPAENAELMYALQAQQQVERRIAEVESQLARARVIENTGANSEVALGTRVRVRRVRSRGQPLEFEIVSSVEADPALGRVSIESPVGEALLGSPAISSRSRLPAGSLRSKCWRSRP
jgi:transcription elongation factor GreA